MARYQAPILRADSVMLGPPRDSMQEAQADADQVPDADAQVMRLQPARRVAASLEAGQPWRFN